MSDEVLIPQVCETCKGSGFMGDTGTGVLLPLCGARWWDIRRSPAVETIRRCCLPAGHTGPHADELGEGAR